MTEEPTAGPSTFRQPTQPDFYSTRDVPIDLTNDDSDGNESYFPQPQAKRARLDTPNNFSTGRGNPDNSFRLPSFAHLDWNNHPSNNFEQRPPSNPPPPSMNNPFHPFQRPMTGTPSFFVPHQGQNHPFAPPRRPSVTPDAQAMPYPPLPRPQGFERSGNHIIDLTGSPSPPPQSSHQSSAVRLPPDLPPKTPVCIGQLTVTALVLYPIPYISPQDRPGEPEWAPVRLQYEANPNKPRGSDTINIRTPPFRAPNGELLQGDGFAVVEQKVASAIGPMIGKGLIRVDGLVRRGPPGLPILPLQILVYTPKGNIPVVGDYLRNCELLLDHPSSMYGPQLLGNYHYHNPHDPPPGGHNRIIMAQNKLTSPNGPNNVSRWSNPSVNGKSVEVQRSQIDEMFKSLKDGDDLTETEPAPEVATPLYPHQKKALTFLLEREREKPGPDGKFTSLWQARVDPASQHMSWIHAVTSKEVFDEPRESKGSILADDMGLGKTISCVSLLAATLQTAKAFATTPLELPTPPISNTPDPSHFAGAVWGMPPPNAPLPNLSAAASKAAAKEQRAFEKAETEYRRARQIKVKSRATLIICPLSTVANWEDQFREHWRGEVTVVGGGGAAILSTNPSTATSSAASTPAQSLAQLSLTIPAEEGEMEMKLAPPPPQSTTARLRQGTPLRVYIYHGNARRPDPAFLADFDAVITTYATLASEYSRQKRSALVEDDEDDAGSSEGFEADGTGGPMKSKKGKLKRKLNTALAANATAEATSALQSIHWFRVVLDEAHSIKETSTVASHASCNLVADRRLCLTGTPVQNKLDDVYALIKFLRVEPLDDKNIWTEYIGSPVKFGQSLGVVRLQTIMKCVTLRRTKETRTRDGKRILTLPPRRDELRYLKFDPEEQEIYNQFFSESKAEFTEMSNKNEVMKNYVGILQKILRLRQICDHFELVQGKEPGLMGQPQDGAISYETLVADIAREGLNDGRAAAVFNILKESATTQCVECAAELCVAADGDGQADGLEDGTTPKRAKKQKNSRTSTRASSPTSPRIVLTRCQHLFCIECYRNCCATGWPDISPDTRQFCSVCQMELSPFDVVEIKPDTFGDSSAKRKPKRKDRRAKNTLNENFRPSTKIAALLSDLVVFSKGNPYSQNYDPSSIEVQMVDNHGNQVDEGVIKTVVFSQWTTMLDKIEDALFAAGIRFERLDGTMKRDDRTKAMDALKYDPSCEVLLVSLKAGGVGLNLTAAQRVYLMDPYWNPAVENQAVDRIHRLGQTRPVTTVKLIIEGSIEARLLEVQRKKTELANMTLGHGQHTKAEILKRRLEELNQLFDH